MPTLVHEVKGRQVTVPEGSADYYLEKGWKLAGPEPKKPAVKRSTRKTAKKSTKAEGATGGSDAGEAAAVPASVDDGADDEG